jgi:drug/metabolite transporter (DMT)-like permease
MRLVARHEGVLWMLASALSFTVETSLIKQLGPDWPAALLLFWRQLAGLALLAPFIVRDPSAAFATPTPWLLLARSALGIGGLYLAVLAYQGLSLAEANALSFTRPLFVIGLSGWLLGERLSASKIGLSLLGFVGVLVLLAPAGTNGSAGRLEAQGAALGAALLFALTIIAVKAMSRSHSAFTLMVYATVLGAGLIAPFAWADWRIPADHQWPLLLGIGAFGLLTQGCYIRGMALGEASVLVNIDYTRLLFAAAAGWWVFGDPLSAETLLGALLIVTAAWGAQRVSNGTQK